MSFTDKKGSLPPMPGALPQKREIKGVPIVIYCNGEPVKMNRKEALAVMAQIVQILMYLDEEGM